jgi:NAD(P)-dependent dehydrogenase (short-subunit alcohol dehydrogenase family)
MVKQVLCDMKRMLGPGVDLRLGSLDRDHRVLQRTFLHRLDLSVRGRNTPHHRLALHLVFVHAEVVRVAKSFLFMPVKQGIGLRRLLDELGVVDSLINNAGIARGATFVKITKSDWDAVVRTDLATVINVTKPFIGGMIDQHFGSVVNIADR